MMRPFLCRCVPLFLVLSRAWGGDTTVVFNEIMYHPATNEPALEWVELHNQMAIDMDLSAWTLRGGIDYVFAEGAIIPGGGFLVVAIDPPALRAATGLTNVLGPFEGRLSNGGEALELRDRNGRLMDRVDYRDGGKWPVEPDGSGASLARRAPGLPSAAPESWASSIRVGGTPSRVNFSDPAQAARSRLLVPFDALWRYEVTGADLGEAWRAPGYDDRTWAGQNAATLIGYWPFDGNAVAVRGINGALAGSVASAVDRNGRTNGALAFTGSLQQHVSVPGGGGLDAATQGTISLWVKWTGTQDADCCGTYGAVLARQANGQFSDNIMALSSANPATARIVWRQAGGPAAALVTSRTVASNGVWRHVAITFSPAGSTLYLDGVAQGTATGPALNNNPATPLSIGAWAGDGGGFSTSTIDDVAIWDEPLSAAQIMALATQAQTPLDFASPNRALYFAGDGRLAGFEELPHTALPLGPVTRYFRKSFQFGDDPAFTELQLMLAVNDGAVCYLNGQEVFRHNLPEGPVAHATLATRAVTGAALLREIPLSTANLLPGANVFSVEIHQAALDDPGMLFGAELTARVAPPGPQGLPAVSLVFNEVEGGDNTPFRIELVNRGPEAIELGGHALLRTGTSDRTYVLASGNLAPGEFRVLDQTVLGFRPAAGDKLFLLTPGHSNVLDAVEVMPQARGRWPDGAGPWLYSTAATFGLSNQLALRDEIVINEIMYHAPPILELPAVWTTNAWLTFTNTWRYDQSGADLGEAWRAPDYDDGTWAEGPALLYVTTATLPAPKNTLLTLGPTNYYFRTRFVYPHAEPLVQLSLRHIVDDGAVFYLNGVEVLRVNLPAGPITHTNQASTAVGTPAFSALISLPLTNLVRGTNVFAVEVHQARVAGNDIVFGAELLASTERVPRVPYQESTEEWVELFNRSGGPVDLTGWRLDEGIDFRFAPGTRLPAGGSLVVAKDPTAFRAQYPGVAVAGPFTNSLSHQGERLVLKDATNNPADVVHYFDNGRWPEAADGGGASLELRNPFADNSVAETWAASDTARRSTWQTYSYRGIAQASAVGPDGQWREFVMGLLDAGEVWLDDLSVIESPGGTPVQLLQNGSFETGTNKWRFLGTHHGEVIDDPDQPGHKVLRLLATGPTEHMSNHAETTLASGRDVVNGREYQIAFRAKWIWGSRQFHTRLYFNRLARTTRLDVPSARGTPGATNSTYQANLGPTFAGLRHDPPVPPPFTPVTVSVKAGDPDGVAALTLYYSVNGGAWSNLAMTPVSPASTGNDWAATIPGRSAGTIVQFYVQGEDSLGVRAQFPATGPASRALLKVDDGLAATNGLHNMRLILTPADAAWLHATINLMSNDRIGSTLIYNEREIFYDVGIRLKGSEHSRTTSPRLGFSLSFASEQLFRGVHRTVALDRSESTGFGQREMLIHQTLNHAGGLPTKYNDLAHVLAPRREHTGAAELQLARYTDVFLEDQFDRGNEGMLFEYELVYQLNSTDTGTPEGNKVPAPDSVVGTTIRNLGNDPEAYRWTFLIKNNEARDDYSGIMRFAKTMELTGTNFNAQIGAVIDLDQWLRASALCALSGAGDNYGGDGSQHNVQFYVRPGDQRVMFFPHDVDAFFDAGRPLVPNPDLSKLITVPALARAYYRHVRDIIATTYNGTYLGRWAAHFGRLLPAQDFAGHLAFIVQRSNFLLSQLNTVAPNAPFAITTSNGLDFLVATNRVLIRGTAATDVRDIYLAGQSAPLAVTWLSPTSWQTAAPIPLQLGTNLLVFRAYDFRTNQAGTDSITIVATLPGEGTDTDGDEMPNAWESAHGLNPASPNANDDTDGDGSTDYSEYLAGTHPRDPASVLRLSAALDTNATVLLSGVAVAGRSYAVQYRETLESGAWLRLTNFVPRLTNRVIQAVDTAPVAAPSRFYRLVTPSP